MPRGRNFFGRGFWWRGYYGYSLGGYPYFGGWGGGNPFPFCRNFPWLPRWWWATPSAASYAASIPSAYTPGYYPTYPLSGDPYGIAPGMTGEQEMGFLKDQAKGVQQQLEQISKRIMDLEAGKKQ